MCPDADVVGTMTAPFLRTVARTGEAISKPARSVALGISSASDGAGREMLVLAVEVDDAIGFGVDGAEIETVAVTTRLPVTALVIVSANPVSFSIVVSSALFSGLCFRLALRVCRISGICVGDADVCLPFCGDTSRCTSFCTARDAVDLLGKSIRLTISVSIDFCSVTFDCLGPLGCFVFSEMPDVVSFVTVIIVVVVVADSDSYSTILSGRLLWDCSPWASLSLSTAIASSLDMPISGE